MEIQGREKNQGRLVERAGVEDPSPS